MNGVNRSFGFLIGTAALVLIFRLLVTGWFDEAKLSAASHIVGVGDNDGYNNIWQLFFEFIFESVMAIGVAVVLWTRGVWHVISSSLLLVATIGESIVNYLNRSASRDSVSVASVPSELQEKLLLAIYSDLRKLKGKTAELDKRVSEQQKKMESYGGY